KSTDLLSMGHLDGFRAMGEPTDIGSTIGSFGGIDAYQNGPLVQATQGSTEYGLRYQSTELAYRFLCQHDGLCQKKTGRYGTAREWWSNPYGDPALAALQRFPNEGTTPPALGDVLVFWAGTSGHVAIVKDVTSDHVTVIEQGVFNGSHVYVLHQNAGTYAMAGALGWMRAP
ncbi:MAG TPA: CHAP domain-containing protein, partial [Myxococcales bacterium]|nr:CHAP domain-containing protein [Myxococcales bacterium]